MSLRKALWMVAEIIGGIILWAADPEPFRGLVPYLLLALSAIFTYQALSTEKLRDYLGDIASKFSSREGKLMHFAVGVLGFAIFWAYWSGIQQLTHRPKAEPPNKEPERNDARQVEDKKQKPPQPNTAKAEDTAKEERSKPQAAPFFGNLKERCVTLSQDLLSFVNDRQEMSKSRIGSITERNSKTLGEAYRSLHESTSMLFRHSYLPRLFAVQKELSDIHIKDERIDEILNRQQEAIRYEQSYPEYPKESGWINIQDVEELAKRLRGLSHQISPPSAPTALSFSEKQVDTQKRLEFSRVVNAGAYSTGANVFPFGILVTIQTKVRVSDGFVVVEFDNHYATAECDLIDSELVVGETKLSENKTLTDYLRNRQQTSYTIGIGKTPLTPEKPLQVVAFGSVPLHAVKATLFSN